MARDGDRHTFYQSPTANCVAPKPRRLRCLFWRSRIAIVVKPPNELERRP